jgi:hypothetical protein
MLDIGTSVSENAVVMLYALVVIVAGYLSVHVVLSRKEKNKTQLTLKQWE